ncbi:transcription initiation factor TFIID subunit 15b isoform X3 [Quercus suber]|uniref:transcription initiation factor TFIID subunit 15b isoform X3 n=1 Tax=Quercus suber TaxID=58331 RepID=UPI0032DEBF80
MRLTPFVVAPYHYLAHQVDMMVGMVLVVKGGYGGASAEAPDMTTEELRELFGGIGQVGRIKQKRGYKDQWPWNIKIYTIEMGNSKGDAILSYEDPSAVHSAGSFYNNYDMRGFKINVAMAEMSAPKASLDYDQRYLPDQCPHFIFTCNVGMRCLVLCSAMLLRSATV